MTFFKTLIAAALAVTFATGSMAASKENTLILETKNGKIEIELLPDVAPNHVKQVSELANEGFYDNVKFHRVIEGFMAQTGDPTGTGRGGSKRPDLKQEFSNTLKFERGVVGMARSQNVNSANSQFFIMFAEAAGLNNKYTIFGKVTKGMDVVDKIKKGSPPNGSVTDPDVIVKMRTADKL
ncbi:MAG: peptidylprolyl isomerase [Hyphomicrobiales bacterium]